MGIKKYGSVLKQLYTECLKKLSTEDYKAIFESKENIFDYSKELSTIENKLGFKHPALKYIAIYESRINDSKSISTTIEKIRDENILSEGLKMVLPLNKCKSTAHTIIKTKLGSIKDFPESSFILVSKGNHLPLRYPFFTLFSASTLSFLSFSAFRAFSFNAANVPARF